MEWNAQFAAEPGVLAVAVADDGRKTGVRARVVDPQRLAAVLRDSAPGRGAAGEIAEAGRCGELDALLAGPRVAAGIDEEAVDELRGIGVGRVDVVLAAGDRGGGARAREQAVAVILQPALRVRQRERPFDSVQLATQARAQAVGALFAPLPQRAGGDEAMPQEDRARGIVAQPRKAVGGVVRRIDRNRDQAERARHEFQVEGDPRLVTALAACAPQPGIDESGEARAELEIAGHAEPVAAQFGVGSGQQGEVNAAVGAGTAADEAETGANAAARNGRAVHRMA
ncbi:MAG: hypothetical protein IPK27_08665 [Rhodanobacteraceae bacterium]|nr:hypothetical protein [Rhodanobacteraceae bacterium]